MTTEQESPGVPITSIHIDLVGKSILLEADQQPVARITFSNGTLYFSSLFIGPAEVSTTAPLELPGTENPPSVDEVREETKEKEQPVTLSGRLKTKPKEGRADGKGNTTAWAQLAAHVDGEDKAHLYSATFHRHTARIALGLSANDPVTVLGYRHDSGDPTGKRLDTLSVINFLAYPGKSEKSGS